MYGRIADPSRHSGVPWPVGRSKVGQQWLDGGLPNLINALRRMRLVSGYTVAIEIDSVGKNENDSS